MRNRWVLVIEDDAELEPLVRDLLRDEGCRVAVVQDCATAAVALAAVRFDVVLLDTPGALLTADHWAAMARLRALAGDTPTFLFTAHSPSAVATYAAYGFSGVVHKPFDLETLLAVVNHPPAVLPQDPLLLVPCPRPRSQSAGAARYQAR